MQMIFGRSEMADPAQFIRRCGYGEYYDRRLQKISYMRRARMTDMFPRYHVYIEERGDKIVYDLHLDQKRPSYEGSAMHAGEYDGVAVEREAERIRQQIRR